MTSHKESAPRFTPGRHCCVIAVVIVCLTSLAGGLTSGVFLSTAETALLLESEPRLLDFVHHCLTQTAARTGNDEFVRLARALQKDVDSLPRRQDARHPLDAYVGLRRFTDHWHNYIARLDPVVATSVERSLAQNNLVYPDAESLHMARLSIVRLQAAYTLTPASLLASARANLTATDMTLLAAQAQDTGFPALARHWSRLSQAAVASTPSSSSTTVMSDASQTLPHNPTQSELDADEDIASDMGLRHKSFFSLCQRLQVVSDFTGHRSAYCRLTKGRGSPFGLWRTEVLSTDPYVAVIYDFVTDREADIVVNTAVDKLTLAKTGFDPKDFDLKDYKRLGKLVWLPDIRSRTLNRISRRIQDVTGLHTGRRVKASFGEDFQVVNYGIGGHYIPHHDYFKVDNAFSEAEEYVRDSGDRAATFMIYLGDVTRGGATVFPRLGIGARPVKKAALFWYNFNPDGFRDPSTLHGGCPVVIGEKWVANKWIHEISTAMTKSCKLSPWKPENT